MICPAETPEGAACGLVKNLALMAFVSVGAHPAYLLSILEDLGVERLDSIAHQPGSSAGKRVKVFVNGNWFGLSSDADDLVASVLKLRRSLEIPKEIAIVRDIQNRELRFYTDSGRVQRPLFIVERGLIKLKKEHVARMSRQDQGVGAAAGVSGGGVGGQQIHHGSPMNFDDALKLGLVEFLDVEEEETAMIAMHLADLQKRDSLRCQTYTHCEIHPSMILGVCASIIPFPDHNQVREIQLFLNALIVSKKHLSECHGQAGYGSLHEQSFDQDGHSGSCPLLPLEAAGVHKIYGLPSLQGTPSWMQCHRGHCLLHWVQPRGLDNHKPVINRQRTL
jgi:DNA-directed RNA polymerase II subunit RPB2